MKKTLLVVFCILPILFLNLNAQNIEKVFLRKYTQKEGMTSFYVRDIIQDRYGFMYISTQAGIDRFDGKKFASYNKYNDPGQRLSGIDIRQAQWDSVNNLVWVLPGENGINAINTNSGKVIKTIPLKKNNDNEWFLSLLLSNNTLYIGTTNQVRVYNLLTNNFIKNLPLPTTTNESNNFTEVKNIKADYLGNIWVTYSGYGLVIYSPSNLVKCFIPESKFKKGIKLEPIKFNSLIFLEKNTALVGTDKGMSSVKFSDDYQIGIDLNPCVQSSELNYQPIKYICCTNDSSIYIAGGKKLYKFNNFLNRYTVLEDIDQSNESNWLSDVNSIFEDKDNNIWIGCNQGLAFLKAGNRPFKKVFNDNETNEKLDHVTSLYVSKKGLLFVGMFNGLGLLKPPSDKIAIVNKGVMTHHIFEDPFNKIHVSQDGKLSLFLENKLSHIENTYPEFKPFSNFTINSHVSVSSSKIVFGSENNTGILIWDYEKHTIEHLKKDSKKIQLGSDIVNTIYKDRQNKLWVLSDNVITIIDENLSKSTILYLTDTANNLPLGLFFNICENNNSYWITSYGAGIVQLDSNLKLKNILSMKNGLSNNEVYSIFPYKEKLVITTNDGLSVLNTDTKKFNNYYSSDGLHSNNFEEAASFLKNDTLYAGGLRGFSIIDLKSLLKDNLAPQVFISRLKIDLKNGQLDSVNMDMKHFIIPSAALQSNIYFSAIYYNDPERISYSYQLKEKSSEWINLNSQNSISLIGLSPGTYTLRVRAANEDGVWGQAKTLTLQFNPLWYQTLFFRVSLVITGIAIGYGIYRYRLHQLKREEAIRTRIAADLHDDIGSTLTSVRIFTDLGLAKNSTEYFPQIRAGIQEASSSLRDIIWVLDKTNNNAKQLLERIAKFALPLTVARQINFRLLEEEGLEQIELGTELRRDLYLIAKEFITNSLKYSECQHITLTAKRQNKRLHILLEENGIGFNPETISRGNGLNNMISRASKAGYTAILKSKPGEGSSLELA